MNCLSEGEIGEQTSPKHRVGDGPQNQSADTLASKRTSGFSYQLVECLLIICSVFDAQKGICEKVSFHHRLATSIFSNPQTEFAR